jgi:chromosome segregation ATPase
MSRFKRSYYQDTNTDKKDKLPKEDRVNSIKIEIEKQTNILNELLSRIKVSKNEIIETKKKEDSIKESIFSLEQEIKRYEKELKSLNSKKLDIINKNNQDIELYKADIEEKKRLLDIDVIETQKIIDSNNNEINNLSSLISDKTKELSDLEEKLKPLNISINKLTEEKDFLVKVIEDYNLDVEKLKKSIFNLKNDKENLIKEIDVLQKTREENVIATSESNKIISELRNIISVLKKEEEQLEIILSDKKKQIASIDERERIVNVKTISLEEKAKRMGYTLDQI